MSKVQRQENVSCLETQRDVSCVRETQRNVSCVRETQRNVSCVRETQRAVSCVRETQRDVSHGRTLEPTVTDKVRGNGRLCESANELRNLIPNTQKWFRIVD
jgi:hypothetical protein